LVSILFPLLLAADDEVVAVKTTRSLRAFDIDVDVDVTAGIIVLDIDDVVTPLKPAFSNATNGEEEDENAEA